MSEKATEAPVEVTEDAQAEQLLAEPVTETNDTADESTAEAQEASARHRDFDALPGWAKKLIKDQRKEAARLRERPAEEAAAIRQEFAQTIGKALGLVKDEPVDPAQLTEQLTQAQQAQRQSALELAIFRSTPDATVANALLDSRSFLEKVADLDPSDGLAIAAAVGEAVQNNPALGKRVPAPNPAQGSSGSGPVRPGQLNKSDLAHMQPEEIEKARKEGRLDDLMGIRQ